MAPNGVVRNRTPNNSPGKAMGGSGGGSASDVKALKQLHQSNLDAHEKLLAQVSAAQAALEASASKHARRYDELKKKLDGGGGGAAGGNSGAEGLASVRESVADNRRLLEGLMAVKGECEAKLANAASYEDLDAALKAQEKSSKAEMAKVSSLGWED